MKFNDTVERYIRDLKLYGRINSKATENLYRLRLGQHSDDIANRDPRKVGRDDIKRTLSRWDHPNTQAHAHAVLRSFYDWAVEEGYRDTNPARQVRRARTRKPIVYRLTATEVVGLLDACHDFRERALIGFGALAGLRNQELRALKGRHLSRPGWVWVSADIAKGNKERWVPVLPELEHTVAEARERRTDDQYVICTHRSANPGINTRWVEIPHSSISPKTLGDILTSVARRAGIAADITPHSLRHAFGDYIARQAGLKAAQAVLGHASVATTESTYTGPLTLDEIAAAVGGITYRPYPAPGTPVSPVADRIPVKVRIEDFGLPRPFTSLLESKVAVYAAHFEGAARA